jgi:hypothetical protein
VRSRQEALVTCIDWLGSHRQRLTRSLLQHPIRRATATTPKFSKWREDEKNKTCRNTVNKSCSRELYVEGTHDLLIHAWNVAHVNPVVANHSHVRVINRNERATYTNVISYGLIGQNCTAFGRECIFITVPESAARKKEREQRERGQSKSGAGFTFPDWTKDLPVRTQSASSLPDNNEEPIAIDTTTPGTPPRDYEWEAYQQDVEADRDAWERLPAEPEETQDDVFEDENDDEDQIATDLTIRIGRMIICENVTGFFRPQYAEEVVFTLFGGIHD